jgi:hypothetical protein
MAKAAALSAAGQLQMESAPLFQQFAMRRAMMNLANNQDQDPSNTAAAEQMIAYARMTNPEMAKEMESRLIPGVGMAKIPVPDGIRQELRAHESLNNYVKDLQAFVKKNTTIIPGTAAYNTGAQKALDLQQALREAKLGGVFKEAEQKLLDKYIDESPANMFHAMNTDPKLKNILHSNEMSTNTLKKNYGLPIKVSPDNSMEGKTISNAKGERMVMKNGKWTPIK